MGRYLEFRCLEGTFVEWDGGLKAVPCSKADVFKSKAVSLIEKRMLMKYLNFAYEYKKNEQLWKGMHTYIIYIYIRIYLSASSSSRFFNFI